MKGKKRATGGWIFAFVFVAVQLLYCALDLWRKVSMRTPPFDDIETPMGELIDQVIAFLRHFLAGPSLVPSPSETLVPREIGGACLIGLFVVVLFSSDLSRREHRGGPPQRRVCAAVSDPRLAFVCRFAQDFPGCLGEGQNRIRKKHSNGCFEHVEKVAFTTFSSFCKGLHAADWPLLAVNRPHLPLERCKNRRTGRRFLRIDEGESKPLSSGYIGLSTG